MPYFPIRNLEGKEWKEAPVRPALAQDGSIGGRLCLAGEEACPTTLSFLWPAQDMQDFGKQTASSRT